MINFILFSNKMTLHLKLKRQPGETQGEFLSRLALTEIYQKGFPTCRPDFLKSPKTDSNLELDGYNEELEIAFEYNGKQHYEFPNKYHKSQKEFEEQVKRDIFKFKQCELHGIYLINIPYNIPYEEIKAFILYYTPEKVLDRQEKRISEVTD